ncbi:MAG: hypothetical protein ACI4VE_00255 [Clostridia bacterium]
MEYFGYVKANVLDNEYILRQDMESYGEAKELFIEGGNFTFYNKDVKTNVVLKNMLEIEEEYVPTINEENQKEEMWAVLSNNNIEEYLESVIKDYEQRQELITSIVRKLNKNNISGLILNLQNINDYDSTQKFIQELTPRLREIGICVGVKINDEIKEKDFINIVDYLVK